MNKWRLIVRYGALFLFFILILPCCTTSPPPGSGFLEDYSILRPDPDDVSPPGQGEVRAARPGVQQLQGADAQPGAELGHRPHAHVHPGRFISFRPSGIHGRPDPHRPGPLHSHGDRMERSGQGRYRVLRRPGGL